MYVHLYKYILQGGKNYTISILKINTLAEKTKYVHIYLLNKNKMFKFYISKFLLYFIIIVNSITQQELPRTVIAQNNHQAHLNQQLLEMSRKLLAAGNSTQLCSSQAPVGIPRISQQQNQCSDPCYTKRIRRSEDLLKKAADCVSRGQTFQTVSDQFNIPISTIRLY